MRPGERIGRYELVRELGRGGMGSVWAARDPLARRDVALKLLHDAGEPDDRERFRREAQALARLAHPGVLRVLDVSLDGPGPPFLVTELLEGRGLDRLCQEGPLEPRRAAELVRELAGALVAVHAAGVLHRDLKPGNVLVRPDGRPVLLDFGLARLRGRERLTQTGAMTGTPAYMAPEQAEAGHLVDERADVWGLGAVLYHLLVGRAPYEGESIMAVLAALLSVEPEWPRARRPEVPLALDAIVRRALARDRDRRFGDAAELEEALADWLQAPPPANGAAARRGAGQALGLVGLTLVGLALVGLAARALTGRGARPPEPGPRPASFAPEVLATPAPVASIPVATDPRPSLPERGRLAVLVEPAETQASRIAYLRLAFLDPARLLVSREDRTLRVWDVDPPRPASGLVARFPEDLRPPTFLLLGARDVLAASQEQVFRLDPARWLGVAAPWWTVPEADAVRRPSSIRAQVNEPLIHALDARAGLVAVGGANMTPPVRVLDDQGRERFRLASAMSPLGVALSPDGRALAVVGVSGSGEERSGLVEVWDLRQDEPEAKRSRQPGSRGCVAWLESGRFAVGTAAGGLELHRFPWAAGDRPLLLQGEGLAPGLAHGGPVWRLAFSPGPPARLWSISRNDAQKGVPSSAESSLRGWDLDARREVYRATPESMAVALAVSPDGRLVALARKDGGVELHAAPP